MKRIGSCYTNLKNVIHPFLDLSSLPFEELIYFFSIVVSMILMCCYGGFQVSFIALCLADVISIQIMKMQIEMEEIEMRVFLHHFIS